MRRTLSLILLALLALLVASPVLAHGYIVRAIPEDRASLERSPARLQYWFSEALEPEFSTLNLRDQNGQVIASGGVDEDDNTLMTLRLPESLPDGAYVVELRPAFASDGHVVAESRVFFVGDEVGGVSGQAATSGAIPLEVLWKALNYMAVVTLFGTFALYGLVLVPAWGSDKHRAGGLPPRVMRRLNVIIGYALLAAFIANGIGLIQQTMAFFNIGFTQALDTNFINLVRIGSRFGDIWNWRVFMLGIVGVMFLATLYFKDDQPEIVRPTLAASVWLLALVLGSSSVLSHAAGSLMLPWVGIAVDWAHTLAVGFWAGGLVALALVLPPALEPYSGDARRMALLAALRRFSRLATAALVVVTATGVYSASNWITAADEAATPFGLALAVKVGLALGLIAIGALHHMALRPERYARWGAIAGRLGGFMRTVRLESGLALLVLAGAAWLSATPVPVPDFAQDDVEAPRDVSQIDNLMVAVAVQPGGPGINTIDTTVTQDGEPAEGLALTLRVVFPERDVRGPAHQMEAAEPGLYVTAMDDIDRAGRWWGLLDITMPDGETQRAAFEWDIMNEAAVIQSVDPGIVPLAALAGVVLALGFAAYPLARRGVRHLQLDPASVTMALSVTVITTLALAIGYALVQNTRQEYDAALEPPPQVVNTVLPGQVSLDRGRALFVDRCAWEAGSRDMAALLDRLPRTRDEELYFAVREGWRGLPACAGDLSDSQIWDIVNAIRAMRTGG